MDRPFRNSLSCGGGAIGAGPEIGALPPRRVHAPICNGSSERFATGVEGKRTARRPIGQESAAMLPIEERDQEIADRERLLTDAENGDAA
jgi:hypothetical protein